MTTSPLARSESNIKVANAALEKLGVPPISSFSEASRAARVLNSSYADELEAAVSSYPWRFARDRIQIFRTADGPGNWESLFAIPPQVRDVRAVYENESSIRFDVFGRNIACDVKATSTSSVYVEGTVIPGPAMWPGYFRSAFISYLAAAIAMPILQDEKTANYWLQVSGAAMARAKSRDAQARTPARVNTQAFIRARRGGR
jgi:hypothetical protein